MKFEEIITNRYSVRKYTDQKVEPEKLEKILKAAHVAPTAANKQPVHLIVIQSVDGFEKIGKAANIYGAPLAIIVCAAILTDHMMLQATDLGLGSVWVCYFKPDVIKEEFKLPDNLEPINILAIGYDSTEGGAPNRFDDARITMEELVSYETL